MSHLSCGIRLYALLAVLLAFSPGITFAKPDLTATDIWEEQNIAHFQVQNLGDESTGYNWDINLDIDGQDIETFMPQEDIKPGQRWDGVFTKDLSSFQGTFAVTVTADHGGDIDEENENNNARTETWGGDTSPPIFKTDPYIEKVTDKSVTINFDPAEPASAVVLYCDHGGDFDQDTGELPAATSFSVYIDNLNPSTIYRYQVKIADAAGNATHSAIGRFQTDPSTSDIDPPGGDLIIGERIPGTTRYPVEAKVQDNDAVDRVEFYVEGDLVLTDYTPPFELVLDSEDFPQNKRAQRVDIHAYDRAKNVKVITSPWSTVPSTPGPSITPNFTFPSVLDGEFRMPFSFHDSPDGVKYARFYVDGEYRAQHEFRRVVMGPEGPIDFILEDVDHTFVWNTLDETDGVHDIRIEAEDRNFHTSSYTDTVEIDNPDLERAQFEVARHWVAYDTDAHDVVVALTLENVGTGYAEDCLLLDYELRGLQVFAATCHIAPLPSGGYTPEVTIEYDDYGSIVRIDPSAAYYTAGTEVNFTIHSVPLLTAPSMYTPEIPRNGVFEYSGPWSRGDDSGDDEWETAIYPLAEDYAGTPIDEMIDEVLSRCNYVALTCPYNLFSHFGGGYFTDRYEPVRQPVIRILKAMGEVASVRGGAVAFVPSSYDRAEINALLRSGAGWASKLDTDYPEDGYLMLVGETEILPADSITVDSFWYSAVHVYPSDLYYANTSGNSFEPELRVGRVIGNTAADLLAPLRKSALVARGDPGYPYSRNKAVIYSGDDSGKNMFRSCAADLQDQANGLFTIVERGRVDDNDLHDEFQADIPDSDYIVYRGHGNETSWSDVSSTGWLDAGELGTGSPVVAGWACRSGQYEDSSDDNFVGLCEDFLNVGAAVSIGAVVNSPRGENNDGARAFQSRLYRDRWTAGAALRRAKRNFKTDYTSCSACNYDNRRWTSEYNLYGDPAYGNDYDTSRGIIEEEIFDRLTAQTNQIEIKIPDIGFQQNDDGTWHASIEGQGHYGVPGNPYVPMYIHEMILDPGLRITDVVLVSKEDQYTTSGVLMELDVSDEGASMLRSPNVFQAPDDVWFPDYDFEWNISESKGARILTLKILPFQALPARAEVTSFHYFKFQLQTEEYEEVALKVWDALAPVSEGIAAQIPIEIYNTGDESDFLLEVAVGTIGGDTLPGGLVSRWMYALDGRGIATLSIPTGGLRSGLHRVMMRLYDRHENLLAEGMGMFEVLGSRVALQELVITPDHYRPGDIVTIEHSIESTGDAPVEGTAVIICRDMTCTTIQHFEGTVPELLPGESFAFQVDWDTTGLMHAQYFIVGYMIYDGGTSAPVTAILNRATDAEYWTID